MNVPVLVFHIAGGGVALLAGGTALAVRKGGALHVKAGTVFAWAMLAMTSGGTLLAVLKPTRISVVAGLLAFYLVATGWTAMRRRDGRRGWIETLAPALALFCVAASLTFAIEAAQAASGRLEHIPAAGYLPFGALALLAAALDLNFLLREAPSRVQRLTRHVWRMSTALLIAALSFFIGQQKVMPVSIQGSPLLILPLPAVLAVMLFWIARLRLLPALRRRPPPPIARAEAGA
ncbi:MAG: hypothetical protein QOH81_1998 [Sphingomonadales bacterium]|jgi:uncharacterized membrane protein|nr:hypothetical protein [Sphingomonadales bacterium]